MDNFIKSFWDEWASRVKNPLIASFILAHIALNWQAYSLLIWATPPFEERMELFRLSNGQYQLVWQPFALGLLLTVILPVISFAISKVNHWATAQHKSLIEKQVHEQKSERAKLEDERESQREKRAKQREKEIGELARARSNLEKEVGPDAVKHAEDQLSEKAEPEDVVSRLTPPQIVLILLLSHYGSADFSQNIPFMDAWFELLGHHDFDRAKIELAEAVTELSALNVVAYTTRNTRLATAKLTAKGYGIYDELSKKLGLS